MSDPIVGLGTANAQQENTPWTRRFVFFLRVMAGIMMLKGLYHWSSVIGLGDGPGTTFEMRPPSWQATTIFFAVLDLVAAVGLWLAAAWGGVVWLTAAISMMVVELFFPQIFGGRFLVILLELTSILIYVGLALMTGRERND